MFLFVSAYNPNSMRGFQVFRNRATSPGWRLLLFTDYSLNSSSDLSGCNAAAVFGGYI
jgi:hypothetical protein